MNKPALTLLLLLCCQIFAAQAHARVLHAHEEPVRIQLDVYVHIHAAQARHWLQSSPELSIAHSVAFSVPPLTGLLKQIRELSKSIWMTLVRPHTCVYRCNPAPVTEPGTWALIVMGCVGLLAVRRRLKSQADIEPKAVSHKRKLV